MTEAPSRLRLEDLASTNEKMARCLKLAALAAKSEVPVLILGETGTGKTLLARAIHNSSARADRACISFNSSAMSDTLLESELFGHERGAFTGAHKMTKGKFELADTGTLFLDEIADMSPLAQAKILRAVEYGEFERLGGERMLHSNARIIAATNRSLRRAHPRGAFPRGSLPPPQRRHPAHSAAARAGGGTARAHRGGTESRHARRRQEDHIRSSRRRSTC